MQLRAEKARRPGGRGLHCSVRCLSSMRLFIGPHRVTIHPFAMFRLSCTHVAALDRYWMLLRNRKEISVWPVVFVSRTVSQACRWWLIVVFLKLWGRSPSSLHRHHRSPWSSSGFTCLNSLNRLTEMENRRSMFSAFFIYFFAVRGIL